MGLQERVKIRRVLTDSALARQHDPAHHRRSAAQALRGAVEAVRALALPGAGAGPRVQGADDAGAGEYEAVDLFSRIAGALAINGAPLDLVAAATRVATDEIRHADYAFRFAALLGARDDVVIDVRSRRAEQRWGTKLDMETLDRMMIEIPAIGEGLACALLAASRERASDVVARPLYDSILADEVHHTRLGWYYLAWRAPQWTTAERQRIADRAGEAVVEVEKRFWWGRDAPAGSRKAARALGVLESEGQREVIRRIMEEEIVPALDELGLGASHAWEGPQARAMRSPFPPFAWRTSRRAPTEKERAAVAEAARELLRFQRTLRGWRMPRGVPDATPFVSLYAKGRLCGCFGTGRGAAGRAPRAGLLLAVRVDGRPLRSGGCDPGSGTRSWRRSRGSAARAS